MKNAIIATLVGLGLVVGLNLSAEDAKPNYTKECAKCHGADGKGKTKMGQKLGIKDYTDAKVQAEMKDDKAFKSIKEGQKDGDKELMKSYADILSDDEIKALVAYMRAFKK
jgi:cytochrome c553